MKRALKEALKEWMDEKFIAFGKWSAAAVAAMAVAALTYFILWVNGWAKPLDQLNR
jgi:hypothetical protein